MLEGNLLDLELLLDPIVVVVKKFELVGRTHLDVEGGSLVHVQFEDRVRAETLGIALVRGSRGDGVVGASLFALGGALYSHLLF